MARSEFLRPAHSFPLVSPVLISEAGEILPPVRSIPGQKVIYARQFRVWVHERFTRDVILRENFDPQILPNYKSLK